MRTVVGLTTIPPRFCALHVALASLCRQTRPPDKVYLHVPWNYERFPGEVDIGLVLSVAGKYGVEVVRGEDYGPISKLFVLLLKEADPGANIVVCDDDHSYDPGWLAGLAAGIEGDPSSAFGYRGNVLGEGFSFGKSRIVHDVEARAEVDLVSAARGWIYKRSFFGDGCIAEWQALRRSHPFVFFNDDVWTSGMLARKGVRRVVLPLDAEWPRGEMLKDCLCWRDGQEADTDRQIRLFAGEWRRAVARMPEHTLAVSERDGKVSVYHGDSGRRGSGSRFYRHIPPLPVAFPSKCLFCSAVGERGRTMLKDVVGKFGKELFDYLLFVYDGSRGWEEQFPGCRFVHGRGQKWGLAMEHLTPDAVSGYGYVFLWDDDAELLGFDVAKYLDVVCRNGLEVSQPALTRDSCWSLAVGLQDPRGGVGRFTNFVESGFPVFTAAAWVKWRGMMSAGDAGWGSGWDLLAFSECGYERMGVVDCQPVRHPFPGKRHGGRDNMEDILGVMALKGRRLFSLYTFCGLT
jgi:hypothetical protein